MKDRTIRPDAAGWIDLDGRICVVTGAGSGIGAETARQLAALGGHVGVLDRDGGAAAAVAAAIVAGGGRAINLSADVANPAEVAGAAARVEKELGACAVLVNNAAARGGEGLMTLSPDDWQRVIAANLTGALICAQAFGRQMIAARRGGSIVHVASITGHHPMPHSGAYSVSKAGMSMLSRQLALELAEHGIRSNVVSPGLVHTPATEAAYDDAGMAAARRKMVPAGRIGTPQDMAGVIAFLASDRAGYVTGQDIVVDGGLSQVLMGQVPRATAR